MLARCRLMLPLRRRRAMRRERLIRLLRTYGSDAYSMLCTTPAIFMRHFFLRADAFIDYVAEFFVYV